MGTFRTLLACTLAALVGGCSGDAGPDTRDAGPVDRGQHEAAAPDHARPDRAAPPDVGQPKPDLGAPKPDKGTPKPKAHKVAAIQYGAGDAALVSTACTQAAMPNVCALRKLVAQARAGGALLVVLPEYGFGWDQKVYEPDPKVGDNPATNTAWPPALIIPTMAKEAKLHKVYLVIHLTTHKVGSSPVIAYNTQVVFDPAGKVVAKHHKINLWDDEPKTLTAGSDVSVFSTPLGTVGLLICADIYATTPLHAKLVKTLKARLIAFSAHWLTAGATGYQITFAKTHGVYVVAANTTLAPGQGGGVFDPTGKALVSSAKTTPIIAYATIPAP